MLLEDYSFLIQSEKFGLFRREPAIIFITHRAFFAQTREDRRSARVGEREKPVMSKIAVAILF